MTDSPVNALLLKGLSTLINQVPALYIQISQQIINAIQRSYLAGGSLLPEPESLAN
jgi:GntR family transcriptional regulator/MocR family aminotransferase